LKKLPARRIIRNRVAVLATIDLDNQSSFYAGKVNNVRRYHVLPSEFETINITQPKIPPQTALCICHLMPKFASKLNLADQKVPPS